MNKIDSTIKELYRFFLSQSFKDGESIWMAVDIKFAANNSNILDFLCQYAYDAKLKNIVNSFDPATGNICWDRLELR